MRDPHHPIGQRPTSFGKRGQLDPVPVRTPDPARKKRTGALTYAVLGAGAVVALTAALSSRSQNCSQTNPNQPQQCSGRTSSGGGGSIHALSGTGSSTAQSSVARGGFGSTGASMHAGS